MKKKPIDKTDELRELMKQFVRIISMVNESQTACCSLTLAQCHALVEIGRSQGISLNRLSQIMELDTSTLCRTVNRLVLLGLVKRNEDSKDRRYIQIILTDQGKESYFAMEHAMHDYYENLHRQIPAEKWKHIIESLQILTKACFSIKCCAKETNHEK